MNNKIFPIATLAFIALSAQAGVPTVELKEYPPLKPLHWCRNADGKVAAQNDDCGPGMVEVSSIATQDASGKTTYAPLGTTLAAPTPLAPPARAATPAAPDAASAAAAKRDADKQVLRRGQKSLLKLLAFGLLFGLVAKLFGRSFFRWFFAGIAVDFALVAANLIAY